MESVLIQGVKDKMQDNGGSTLCTSMMQVELDMPAVYPSLVGKRLRITMEWKGRENELWIFNTTRKKS